MAYSEDQPSRRRRRPDVDEAEIVPGYDSESDTDDDSRYVLQPRDDDEEGRPEIIKRRRFLEDIVAGGRDALPSPTSSCGSDETISDGSTGAGTAPVAPASYPCPICQRGFGSQKAVHGHMRVHDPHGRQGQEKEQPVTLGASWAVTGKRGWIGGRAIYPVDEVDNSVAIVVAEPKLSVAEPIAGTNLSSGKIIHGRSSVQQNLNASMAVVVAAVNPSNQVVSHQPAAPQIVADQPAAPQVVADQPAAPQVVAHPPAAPQAVADQPAAPQAVADQPAAPQAVADQPAAPQAVADQPAAPQAVADQPAAPQAVADQPAAPQAVADQPAAPQVVADQPAAPQAVADQPVAPPSAGEQDHVEGFACAECGRWFSTHQGLGGHVAGHKNRRREAEAAAAAAGVQQGDGAGAVACRGFAKTEKVHVCKVCGQEFKTGVALGGHMRKHYAGPPIGQKKQGTSLGLHLAPAVEEAAQPALAPVIEAAQPAPAPAVEVAETAPAPAVEVAETAPAPAAAGSVRIFGVNIVLTPAEQEGSAVTEDSAPTSTQRGDP